MEFITGLLLGLIAGAVSIWLIFRSSLIQKKKAIAYTQEQMHNEQKQRIEAEAKLKAQTQREEQERQRLREQFSELANQALKQNNSSFLELANEVLNKYVSKAESNLENKKQAVEEIVKPLRENLEKHEQLVKDLQQNNKQTYGSLKNYLDSLAEAHKSLEKETNALVTALKQPAVRGRWGEIGLRRIVEYSGMSQYCDFEEQTQSTASGKGVRPDMIVNLPEGHKIIVDSKVPLQRYLEALETEDANRKNELLAQHARDVQAHMKNLAGKSYWEYFPESADFVVLYIEVESAFSAALTQNPQLVVEGIEKRVIFATPTTLITLLQTVAYTWRQFQATQSAREIWNAAREFFDRSVVFAQHLNSMGAQLEKLTEQYNKTIGSWEKRLQPSLIKMQEKGAESASKPLTHPDKVNKVPRRTTGNEENEDEYSS